MTIIIGIIIGLVAGLASGLVGIGGGIIMIPAMVMTLGFSQHLAQGTSLLAMLPPVSILAVYAYYKEGDVNITIGIVLALALVVGGYFGAKLALMISPEMLKKVFGFMLLFFAIKMIFFD